MSKSVHVDMDDAERLFFSLIVFVVKMNEFVVLCPYVESKA